MKKSLFILLTILFMPLATYCQYFENTGVYSVSSPGDASINLLSASVGYNGNYLLAWDEHSCLMCLHTSHMQFGSGSAYFGTGFPLMGNTHFLYSDKANNGYYFGSINKTLTIGGVSTSIVTNTDTLAFIKFDTTGIPWALNRSMNSAFVDYHGNVYISDDSLLTFYNTAGQIQWQRPMPGVFTADTLLNYYQYINGNLTKFDSAGVMQWQLPATGYTYNFTRLATRLFQRTAMLTNEINLTNGSVLNTSSYGGDRYDSRGNYYNSNFTSKGDSTGLLWSYHLKDNGGNVSFTGQMDKDDNIYYYRQMDFFYEGAKHNMFIPPYAHYYNDPDVYSGFFTSSVIGYKVNPYDTIDNGTLTTGAVAAICAGGTLSVPFTYNNYFVQYYDAGFSIELSDSSGSFAQPVVIGTGNESPIACNIPFFNLQGTNYRVRVVSNTVPKIIGTPCPTPLTAYQPYHVQLSLTNYSYMTWQACAPALLFIDPPGPYYCNWFFNDYQSPDLFLPIFTNFHSYSITPYMYGDYKVVFRDSVTGCTYEATRDEVSQGSNSVGSYGLNFKLPASPFCSNEGPLKLIKPTLHGAFSGPGIYGDWFYADSTGAGTFPIHYVTYDTVSCYTTDTTEFITVDTCSNLIKTLSINNGNKSRFCAGDSMFVDFSYDTTYFPSGTKFYLEISSPNGTFFFQPYLIDSSYSSPIKTIATLPGANRNSNMYRYRVITLAPLVKGSPNTDGYITVFQPPVIRNFYTPQNVHTNCGYGINVLHVLADASIYTWHHDSLQYIDTNIVGNKYFYPFGDVKIIQDTSSSFLATGNGYYWVEISNEGGCVVVTDSILITDSVNLVQASLSPLNSMICVGDSAFISITTDSANSINWTCNGNPLSVNNIYNFYTSQPGIYIASVTNPLGCSDIYKSTITNYAIPTYPINTTAPYLCLSDSLPLTITASGLTNIQWYLNGVLQNQFAGMQNIYAKDSGTYYITYTLTNYPCPGNSTKYIPGSAKPTPLFVSDSIYYCSTTTSLQVQATCNYTGSYYNWHLFHGSPFQNFVTTTNSLTATIIPSTSNGIYTLIVNSSCPSNGADTLRIFPYTMPPVTLNSIDTTSFCIVDSAQLFTTFSGGDNYLWLLNNTDTLSNGTSTTLNAYTQGSYTVTVSDSVCKNISNAIIITTPCVTGLTDLEGNILNAPYVVPNPAHNTIVLHIPRSLKNSAIELYEASGKLLLTQTATNIETTLTLHDYKPGIYFLKIADTYLRLVKLRD